MPIHTKWLDLIINGEKIIELRRQDLREGIHTVLFYECKTGQITAAAEVLSLSMKSIHTLESQYSRHTCVTSSELSKYAAGNQWLLCIVLMDAIRLTTPITLAEVGLTRAPQSYVYRDIDCSRLQGVSE